jgi:hypothetical protein
MALKANLKGAKSARDSFGPLYNKIVAGKFGGDDAAAAAASSPAKGSPLKRKGVAGSGGVDGDGGDDDDEDGISPAKKTKGKKGSATPRKGKAKGKAAKDEVKAGDNNDNNGVQADDDSIVVKAEVLDDGVDDAGDEV